MVELSSDKNSTFAIGVAGSFKIIPRLAFTSEYFLRIPPKVKNFSYTDYYNSFSIGIDLDTGGHVFQFHFSNSKPMYETGVFTVTIGNWLKGGIHLGFNITRTFLLSKKGNKK